MPPALIGTKSWWFGSSLSLVYVTLVAPTTLHKIRGQGPPGDILTHSMPGTPVSLLGPTSDTP